MILLSYLEDKHKAGIITLSFVINVISGTLIIYLHNPVWIIVFLLMIIICGLFGLWFFILFLFEYVKVQVESEMLKELELELKRLKKDE